MRARESGTHLGLRLYHWTSTQSRSKEVLGPKRQRKVGKKRELMNSAVTEPQAMKSEEDKVTQDSKRRLEVEAESSVQYLHKKNHPVKLLEAITYEAWRTTQDTAKVGGCMHPHQRRGQEWGKQNPGKRR